ncbi:MAG: SDR family NAD(P)-dependent oxidoreductase [bacterium]|nr:SDR family NAD(P)-dependent oxidoreductase [bacterium]
MDHRGRVVVVTGASSGIGRQVALDFAARGADLVLVARRAALLDDVAAACRARGVRIEPLALDVAAPDAPAAIVGAAAARLGRLDVLVNNAGISKHKQIYAVTPGDLEQTIAVNLLAPMRLTLAALPAMLRQGGGCVVNVSSVAGKLPPPRESVYAASKFGLTGFTEGLWLDLQGSGVHAAVIHVGPVDTEIWEKVDEPAAFQGRKWPASAVSAAVLRAVEERRHEIWVPGRYRFAWLFRILMPGAFRAGSARFDPVPPEVVAAARARAGAFE